MKPIKDLPLTPLILEQIREKYESIQLENEKTMRSINKHGELKLPHIKDQQLQKTPATTVTCPDRDALRSKPLKERLKIIQDYLQRLGYNHTPIGQFFPIHKKASMKSLMDTAKRMIKYSLPIRCLEATVCAAYLTNGVTGLDRFMLSFQSVCHGLYYRHIVLGVHHKGLYGALGLSRRSDLMFKELKFKTLTELIREYETAYENNGHRLVKIYLGLPIPHDEYTCEKIVWRHCSINLSRFDETQKTLADYRKFIA